MTKEAPRVVLVGDHSVGKTSLIHRIQTGEFQDSTVPTIGAGVFLIDQEVNGQMVSFQLWDTAGDEKYRNIIPIYFKNSAFAIVVFAVDDLKSFQNLQSWVDEVRMRAELYTKIIIVGNKVDTENPEVSEELSVSWAKENSLTILYTSAKTGQNVNELVEHLAISVAQMDQKSDMLTANKISLTATNSKPCC